MRRLKWWTLLALFCLTPTLSHAQARRTREAERKIEVLLAEFQEQLRGYERELKYFQSVPEFNLLFELCNQLLGQAAQMRQLDSVGRGSGPAIFELSREMDRTARKLDAATTLLKRRAEAVASKEDRAVAARMKAHADAILKTIDGLSTLFR